MSWILLALVGLPLAAGALIALVRPVPEVAVRWALWASVGAFAAAMVTLTFVIVDGPFDALAADADGRAVVGLTADRIGAVLVVLTTGVAVVVQAFAGRSLHGDPRAKRFHILAAVLTSSTTTVALAATASGLFVAWIVTSITLTALIAHKAPWSPAVVAARRTAGAFAVGDTAFLVALVVALVAVGDLDMRTLEADAVALDGEQLAGLSALTICAVLLVVAGVARSALVPLHRWLPSTLAAPTPVSALLHAGVINGAGVLLIRFAPVFGGSAPAMTVAFVLGLATALFATAVMLVRTDVKGSLVWSTSGQMGFMVLQLGVGAFAAALFHIVGHALYKASMFLGAGGSITAHARQETRPHLGRRSEITGVSTITRVVVGLVVPVAAFALALALIDPHLTAAATILIVVFGSLSAGRAANGWVSSAPLPGRRTLVSAVAGTVALVFAYVGGLTLFETFVADAVPFEVPAAVGPAWVAVVLAVLSLVVVVIAALPGRGGDQLRRRLYGWLVGTGAPRPSRRRPAAITPAGPTVRRRTSATSTTHLLPAQSELAGSTSAGGTA